MDWVKKKNPYINSVVALLLQLTFCVQTIELNEALSVVCLDSFGGGGEGGGRVYKHTSTIPWLLCIK